MMCFVHFSNFLSICFFAYFKIFCRFVNFCRFAVFCRFVDFCFVVQLKSQKSKVERKLKKTQCLFPQILFDLVMLLAEVSFVTSAKFSDRHRTQSNNCFRNACNRKKQALPDSSSQLVLSWFRTLTDCLSHSSLAGHSLSRHRFIGIACFVDSFAAQPASFSLSSASSSSNAWLVTNVHSRWPRLQVHDANP